MRLQGKVALIIHAQSALGKTLASHLAQEGAIIVAQTLPAKSGNPPPLHVQAQTYQEIAADSSKGTEVTGLVNEILRVFGRIDILINCVSSDTLEIASASEPAQILRRMLDLYIKSSFLCSRAVIPAMQAQGSGCILTISQLDAPVPGGSPSEATMVTAVTGGLHSLTLSLARELTPTIRANMLELTGHLPQETTDSFAPLLESALFLLSDTAAVSGQVIQTHI